MRLLASDTFLQNGQADNALIQKETAADDIAPLYTINECLLSAIAAILYTITFAAGLGQPISITG